MNTVFLGAVGKKNIYRRTVSGIYDDQGIFICSFDHKICINAYAHVELVDMYGGESLSLSLQEHSYCMLEIAAIHKTFTGMFSVETDALLEWHAYSLDILEQNSAHIQIECIGERARSIGFFVTTCVHSFAKNVTYNATHRTSDTHSFFQAIALLHAGNFKGSGNFDIHAQAAESSAIQQWQGVYMGSNSSEWVISPSYRSLTGNVAIEHSALCCRYSESFLLYMQSRGFNSSSIQTWYARSVLRAVLMRIKAAGGRDFFVSAIEQNIFKININ
jgi:hypothetical protein